MTPQASSGWSRRACATIASAMSRGRDSTRSGYRAWLQARDQRLLQPAEPAVDGGDLRTRVVRIEIALAEVEGVLRHVEPRPEHQPDVVEPPQPRVRVIAVERQLAA